MKSRKAFLLRIDPALHDELERWAQQELRSLNGQIEYLLKDAVARRKRQLAQDAAPSRDKDTPDAPEASRAP